jgi:hypothetical protein
VLADEGEEVSAVLGGGLGADAGEGEEGIDVCGAVLGDGEEGFERQDVMGWEVTFAGLLAAPVEQTAIEGGAGHIVRGGAAGGGSLAGCSGLST